VWQPPKANLDRAGVGNRAAASRPLPVGTAARPPARPACRAPEREPPDLPRTGFLVCRWLWREPTPAELLRNKVAISHWRRLVSIRAAARCVDGRRLRVCLQAGERRQGGPVV